MQFAKELQYSRPGEFFHFGANAQSGLCDPTTRGEPDPQPPRHVSFNYHLSKLVHDTMFSPGKLLNDAGTKLCTKAKDPKQGPAIMRWAEHLSKAVLFSCKDCGDCSLPEIGYLCPESQCAKNQRNGPCGGTRGGRCEVDGYGDCIWLRAYERAKHDGTADQLLSHTPVVQDQSLRGTSAWANHWLQRDHTFTNKTNPS
jgi:methylenetetrahydrofolate reductase (NADPH)